MEPTRITTSSAAPSAPAPRGRTRIAAIARAAGRGCSRPGCDTPAAATLIFSYHEQVARVVELLDEREPQAYDLCGPHADRTSPPRGWDLSDTRAPRANAPRRLEDEETVAVLAAALRGEQPLTRVAVVGSGEADDDTTGVEVADEARETLADLAAPTGGGLGVVEVDDDAFLAEFEYEDDPLEEDPLRAALEEVQRVAEPDADAPDASLVQLRREPPTVDPLEEPAVFVAEVPPVDAPHVTSAVAPPPPPAARREQIEPLLQVDDDLTLW